MNTKKPAYVMIKTEEAKKKELKKQAIEKGMTITGIIRFALKKVFNIDI